MLTLGKIRGGQPNDSQNGPGLALPRALSGLPDLARPGLVLRLPESAAATYLSRNSHIMADDSMVGAWLGTSR